MNYLNDINRIHDKINNISVISKSPTELNDDLIHLRKIIKELQTVALKAKNVSNQISQVLNLKTGQNTISTNILNPLPSQEDISIVETKQLVNIEEFKKNNLDIPARIVDTETDIPCNYLYYIKDKKQYCLNINGTNIKGNIGKIFSKESIKTSICKKKNCSKQDCSFSHDDDERNFTVGSWIYSGKKTPYYTRRIGGKNTLKDDLVNIDKEEFQTECKTRESQFMHDLLIYMLLHNMGLIKKYVRWDITGMNE